MPTVTCGRCKRNCEETEVFCERCKFDLRYGKLNASRNGVCIYCEKYAHLSEEHVYGRWLAKRYSYPERPFTHELSRPVLRNIIGSPEIRHSSTSKQRAYTDTVRNVCEKCNNGWMSKTHADAREGVARLADGFWPRFSDEMAFRLARWAFMVAINMECFARILSTTQAQRTVLMDGGVPENAIVSIARLIPEKRTWSWAKSFGVPLETGEITHGTSTFFKVELAGFHVFNIDDARGLARMRDELAFVPSLLRQVWPVNHEPKISNKRHLTVQSMEYIQGQTGMAPDVEAMLNQARTAAAANNRSPLPL